MITNAQAYDFIKANEFDVNQTQGWIDFIGKAVEEFQLKSKLVDNKDGHGITVASKDELELLEALMEDVEDTETTLEYIFEGNVDYVYIEKLHKKCRNCSCCSLVTATFCNVSKLNADETYYQCLASIEHDCLGDEEMNLK